MTTVPGTGELPPVAESIPLTRSATGLTTHEPSTVIPATDAQREKFLSGANIGPSSTGETPAASIPAAAEPAVQTGAKQPEIREETMQEGLDRIRREIKEKEDARLSQNPAPITPDEARKGISPQTQELVNKFNDFPKVSK